MTEEELKKIFVEAQAEIMASYDESKVKAILLNASGKTSLESTILGAFQLSAKLNQELLFKVLSKALCK
ncbi:hypothetical protein [uncultured Megasphaera sp.]|uniref:hypothetical protein n=1 Tax=uncultured Megasphaera sp. TaxID=165188 RepID=UPI0025F3CC10|nr:hypothetical protein [uncultured Megasphaera sp.]